VPVMVLTVPAVTNLVQCGIGGLKPAVVTPLLAVARGRGSDSEQAICESLRRTPVLPIVVPMPVRETVRGGDGMRTILPRGS